jgi:murein DD-endopeptidase MepM/ murein hydrolase activator NlpD
MQQPRFLLLTLLAALPCSCKSGGSKPPPQPESGGAATSSPNAPPGEGQSAESNPAAGQGDLTQDAAKLARQGLQQSYLAGESIKEGDALLDRADLQGALKAYSWAVELDPANQAARDKLHKVQALMGPSYLEAPASIKDSTEQEMVRRAQARLAAEDADKAGDAAMRAGDPDKAIEHYRQAEMILRFNPLVSGGTLDERIVAGKLENAIQTSEEVRKQSEAKAREQAEAERFHREQEERAYRENKIRTLFSQANVAFLNENYERAEALAGQILLEDPNNKQARELRQVVQFGQVNPLKVFINQNFCPTQEHCEFAWIQRSIGHEPVQMTGKLPVSASCVLATSMPTWCCWPCAPRMGDRGTMGSRFGQAEGSATWKAEPDPGPRLSAQARPPIASAFVFPIGDELDFTKPGPGDRVGFHVSDPYLAVRHARKHRPRRLHYGVDLSNGQSGHVVRAVAAGVVEVSEGNALVKVRKAQRVKLPSIVNGKRVYRWSTRYRSTYKWRTGWGNRIVIRHRLPDGQVVYSLYAHLMPHSVLVKVGDQVSPGEPIARVGRTGRASAPHLHLEIRTTRVDESAELADPDDDSESDGEETEGSRAETQLPHTVDPLAFLVDHVMRFDDLKPGSWQARYTLAAVKDGVMTGSKGHFDPDDDLTRASFYAALVATFRLDTPFTKNQFDSRLDALIDSEILDPSVRSRQNENDHVDRSEALELVLRCLDRRAARGESMAGVGAEQLANDFNAQFAGKDAAASAEREAKEAAAAETSKQKKAAAERAERLANDARAHGKSPRAKAIKVAPVKPTPILDPGFEALAHSKKNMSRAECCLLLASALRLGSSTISALERAATRVANSG